MKALSSLFDKKPKIGKRMGELCIEVRAETDFLKFFTESLSHTFDSPRAIPRFEFSKDVLMLCFAIAVLHEKFGDKGRPAYAALIETYIKLVPVAETLTLDTVILLQEERLMLDTLAMGPYIVANRVPPHNIGSSAVSTRFILEKTTQIRFPKIASSLSEGINSEPSDDHGGWDSAARHFLSSVTPTINEDIVPFLGNQMGQAFAVILSRSKSFVR